MVNKYVMEIKKDGYIKYISHLDMVKLFKNAFKKAGIGLAYSQGFNPHPKMGFAQPLPLGYSSSCEILEFETKEDMEPDWVLAQIRGAVPEGIAALSCKRFAGGKSFAARAYAASYEITIPEGQGKTARWFRGPDSGGGAGRGCRIDELCEEFLNQEKIIALKQQKKTGSQKEIDIKNMIRSLSGAEVSGKTVLNAKLDAGSNSNLSPELLISSFISFAGACAEREDIDVKRVALFFD